MLETLLEVTLKTFPLENLWWNYTLFWKHFLASNEPEQCQAPFSTFTFPDLHTYLCTHRGPYKHGEAGQVRLLLRNWSESGMGNCTRAQRLSLLNPTWYFACAMILKDPTSHKFIPFILPTEQGGNENLLQSMHLDLSRLNYFQKRTNHPQEKTIGAFPTWDGATWLLQFTSIFPI